LNRPMVSINEKLFQYETELPQIVRVASASTKLPKLVFRCLNWKQEVPQLIYQLPR
jgi:hypothetical protein